MLSYNFFPSSNRELVVVKEDNGASKRRASNDERELFPEGPAAQGMISSSDEE